MVHRVRRFPSASAGVLTEAHVQRLWHLQAVRSDRLLTEDGRRVEVLFPGLPGVEGGPDFRAARLTIGGEPVVGDVEVHLRPRHWAEHGHLARGAYAGVVLHVVLDRDRPGWRRPEPSAAPVLVLRPCLPASALEVLRGRVAAGLPRARWPERPAEVAALLEAAGRLRWERRRMRHAREVRHVGAEEAMHRAFFTALGYKRNRGPFRELARLVPARDLAGLAERRIALRLEQGARRIRFWRRHGVRPANTPERRMRSAAGVLARGPVAEVLPALLGTPGPVAGPRAAVRAVGPAVRRLAEWGRMGRSRAKLVVFHAVLPALERGAGEALLAHHPLLATNRREADMLSLAPAGVVREVASVLRQMGLLELADAFERPGDGPRLASPKLHFPG